MYTHLSFQDRITIEIQLKRWVKQKEIAKILERDPGTISREIDRNSIQKRKSKKKQYFAKEAHINAYQSRRRSQIQSMKINLNSELKKFIIEQFQNEEIIPSPKIIAELWNQKQQEKKNKISHTSIYKWLETGDGNKYKQFLAHSFKWYKRKKWEYKKSNILHRIPIEKRPEKINNRTEIWHFEADLIVSKKGFKWALLTLIDRKTRLPRIFKLKDKSSENIMELIKSGQTEIGIKSVTFDNGMEFAKHYILQKNGIDTYFCNPYSSREKWSIENLNKIIRRFFPKWTIFDDISEEKIKSICDKLANTPREILEYLSPNQVHFQ